METDLGYNGGLTCAMQCADLDRSIAWYAQTLGFELLYRVEDIAWCELRTPVPGVNVGLSQVERPEPKGGATLTFGVEDVERARARLEERGVRFDGETMEIPDMVRLATFFDPDGNTLMLYQGLGDFA